MSIAELGASEKVRRSLEGAEIGIGRVTEREEPPGRLNDLPFLVRDEVRAPWLQAFSPAAVRALLRLEPLAGLADCRIGRTGPGGEEPANTEPRAVNEMDAPGARPRPGFLLLLPDATRPAADCIRQSR